MTVRLKGRTCNLSERTVIHAPCSAQDNLAFCVPAAAQQLDIKVYNHVATLLHVLAFFGHLQDGIRRRKTQLTSHIVDVQLYI